MLTQFIDTKDGLNAALKTLSKSHQLALDLEFDKNYHRYGFNICLMQIFDGSTCYLLDPLSTNMDYQTIFPVLESPNVELVTFAFGEDLRLLHSLGCFPKNIYDLDIASSLLNFPPCSLTNLIEDILSIDTGKSSQLSNWFKRPLTDDQMHYAAQDVLHLFNLKEKFDLLADEKGITHWIEQENVYWDMQDYSDEVNNTLYKEKDKSDLNEVEWHIYKKLVNYRDNVAEKHNKPAFQVIKKENLLDISKDIRALSGWENRRGIFKSIKNSKTKDELIDLVKRAKAEALELGLKENMPAKNAPTAEEMREIREQQKHIKKVKAQLFDPIKQTIIDRYGEQTATYLLSNRIVTELITGSNGDLPPYKKNLLIESAEELNLNKDLLYEIIE